MSDPLPLIPGPDWLDAIWRSPYRLRFELSGGGAYATMFTRAYDRARTLARAALPTERPLAVVARHATAVWADARGRRARRDQPFADLEAMGVSTIAAEAAWSGFYDRPFDDGEPMEPLDHRALKVSWDEADILLWNNLAQDLGVEPRAQVLSRLADPETGVVVHAYDDRGMDITALSPEPIAHLYREFEAWLLDYDRERMAEVFGPQ